MGNNNLSNSEEIYVKVDQNNLIYIDPNTVINGKGEILDRGLEQEKLVMYVNLEADLVPRSILSSDNDSNTLTNIAKGTLNIMGNQNGKDFDTSWTEAYREVKENRATTKIQNDFFQSDDSGQSFGIDTISINVKGYNAIPQVQINFIDVDISEIFDTTATKTGYYEISLSDLSLRISSIIDKIFFGGGIVKKHVSILDLSCSGFEEPQIEVPSISPYVGLGGTRKVSRKNMTTCKNKRKERKERSNSKIRNRRLSRRTRKNKNRRS